MYIDETKTAIRKDLKALGYNSRQVGVKEKNGGYSYSLDITIKDLKIDFKLIKSTVAKYESIRRDQRSYEILGGGNTFISVNYSYESINKYKEENNIKEKAAKLYDEVIEKAKANKEHNYLIPLFKGDNRFYFDREQNDLCIIILDSQKRWNCGGSYGLEKVIMDLELGRYRTLEEYTKEKALKDAENEKAYQKREEERKLEAIEYKKMQTESQRIISLIDKTSIIKDIPEEEQKEVTYQWANMNKNNTLKEYQDEVRKGDSYTRSGKAQKRWTFTTFETLDFFRNHLLTDFNQLEKQGGSASDDPRLDNLEMHQITQELYNQCNWYNLGVEIYFNDKLQFFVDPQGYNYSRYVGIK